MPTPDPQKLIELENRIARMKAATAPKPAKEEHYTMANMAWRMVIELVAGLAIGFGIGYGLDWLFGTLPASYFIRWINSKSHHCLVTAQWNGLQSPM